MNTISMILEPDADGSLHVPLPPELRQGKVKIEARLVQVDSEDYDDTPRRAKGGLLRDVPGTFWMSDDFDAPIEDFRDYM